MKTSEEWNKILAIPNGVVIFDPDGWNRKDWQYSWYEEKITAKDFISRTANSTINTTIEGFSAMERAAKTYKGA